MTMLTEAIPILPGRPGIAPVLDTEPTSLLAGYRFRVCETATDAARALGVRRAVYVHGSGYDVPVPDEYDGRSWLLLAEEAATGRAVGTMRVTPRAHGPFECEEYFGVPPLYRTRYCAEVNRFAILPEHRRAGSGMPAVSLGLIKLVIHLIVDVAGLTRAIVAARPERSFTYEWIGFHNTRLRAPYGSLDAVEHELLVVDFPSIRTEMDTHPLGTFLLDERCPEIVWPTAVPSLGVGIPASQPLRIAVGA